MRLSSLQTFITGVNKIVDLTSQVNRTQEQISRGTRILNPSDDPVASSQILNLNQESAQREQFTQNITLLESGLDLEESTLGSINDSLIRVKELTLQANSGILTVADRQAISAELEIRRDELADLMNTKDSSNEFIFGGFKGKTQPLTIDAAGQYHYQGDEGQRFLQVAASTFVAANDNGKSIFVDVPSAQPTFLTQSNPRNTAVPPASISLGNVIDQETFNESYPEDYIIEFQNPEDLLLIDPTAQPVANFNIISRSDGRVLESNIPYKSGTSIEFNGLSVSIKGQPNIGDTFLIESSDTQDILTTVGRIIEGIDSLSLSADDQDTYETLIANTLNNIDNAQTSVLETRSQVGARLNTLESTRTLHEEIDIISTQLLSSLQDLDYAEAVSQLTFETFVLEAAQQSYVRISGLSLFNSL